MKKSFFWSVWVPLKHFAETAEGVHLQETVPGWLLECFRGQFCTEEDNGRYTAQLEILYVYFFPLQLTDSLFSSLVATAVVESGIYNIFPTFVDGCGVLALEMCWDWNWILFYFTPISTLSGKWPATKLSFA